MRCAFFSKLPCIFIVFLLVRSCLIITLIECLKSGQKSLGSLCSFAKPLVVSARPSKHKTKIPYWAQMFKFEGKMQKTRRFCLFCAFYNFAQNCTNMCKIPEICAISISHPFRKSLAAPALIKLKAGGLTACSGQHIGSSLNTEVSHYNSQVHKCTNTQK